MTPTLHSAFYRFAPLADPEAVARALRQHSRALTGSILVAGEGLNGVVAGPPADVQAFEAALQHDPAFGGAFTGTVFKHSGARTAPFARMKVHVKPELVALGLPGVSGLSDLPGVSGVSNTSGRPANSGPADPYLLPPPAWRELLARDDLVLIDNRNHFEFRLGRFAGAIDPGVDHFRHFAAWLTERLPRWRAESRPVAMYCTGGIRCEKLGPWLQAQGTPVYQLEGGILNYLQQLPDAHREWQGECFVFDNRVALDSHLQETATTAEQVYDPERPDEAWRLARARRLDTSAGP